MKPRKSTPFRSHASITAAFSVTMVAYFVAPSAFAADVIKANNTNNLNLTTSWAAGVVPGASDVAKWDSTVTAANTTTLGGNFTWLGIAITNPGGAVTINTGNTITLGAAAVDIDMSSATQDLTLACPLTMNAANIWNVAASRTVNQSNVVSGTGFSITKQGAGAASLKGANTFTGGVTLTAGTLNLNANGTAATNGPLGTGTLTINGGGLDNTSGASRTLAHVNPISVGADFTFGTSSGTTSNNLALPGTVDLGGATRTITANGGGTLTLNGVISNGGLTKAGTGILTLVGTNTYAGATTVNAGILNFANTTARSGTITVAAAGTVGLRVGPAPSYSEADVVALFNTGTLTGFTMDPASGVAIDTTTVSLVQTTALTGSRGLTKIGSNTLTLNQTNTYTGATTISAGTISAGVTGNLGDAASNLVFDGGSLQITGTALTSLSGLGHTIVFNSGKSVGLDISDAGNTFTADQTLAGFNFTKTGLGALVLNAASYTGATAVSAGTLKLDDSNLIPDGSTSGNVTVDGTLDLNGKSDTINGLSGASTGVIDNTAAGSTSTLTVGNNNQGGTFSGTLKNSGSGATLNLVKTGSGLLNLGGANTFSGSVTVNGGTLVPGVTAPFANVSGITLAGGTILQPDLDTTVIPSPITLGDAGTTVKITAPNLPPNNTGATTQKRVTYNGKISGAGNLTLTGVNIYNQYGLIILGAKSDYTGSTLITCESSYLAGTSNAGNTNLFVRSNTDDALPATTVLTMAGGDGGSTSSIRITDFDLNGKNQTLAGLSNIRSSGWVNLRQQQVRNKSTTSVSTLTINNAADCTYATSYGYGGTMFGGGYENTSTTLAASNMNLTKKGAGTFNLTGNGVLYKGDTTVDQGTLKLNARSSAVAGNNDTFTITIAPTGATLELAYTGTDTVDKLYIGGTPQAVGVYGAIGSGAANEIAQITGSGTLTVNSVGAPVGPGPVDHFVISAISSPQTVGTPITGITLTAQDATNATATGFTGTVTFGGTAGGTGTSGNFVAGVLNSVSVTPTTAGSNLTLTVDDGLSHIGSATITTVQTQYAAWAGGAAFGTDTNSDSVTNGVAWVLGAANPTANATALLPTFDTTTDPAYFIYTYRRSDAAAASSTIAVQYGSNLTGWTTAVDDATNIIITPTNDIYGAGIDKVQVKIKRTLAVGSKLFARLNAVQTP